MLKINDVARLYLGVKGENESRTLQIDMSAWASIYPNATAEILHKRQGDQTKELVDSDYNQDTMILSWTPTDYDTYYEGFGIAEIRMVEGQVVKKTKDLLVTAVAPSIIDGSGQVIASDYQAWLDAVIATKNQAVTAKNGAEDFAEDAEAWAKGTRDGVDVESTDPEYHNNSKYYAEQAADSAEDAAASAEEAEALINLPDVAGAQATTLQPGSAATAEIVTVDGQKKFMFGIPKGEQGEPGAGGVAGITMNGSPIVLDQDHIADLGTVVTSKSDKADKVSGATSGNFAGLDANGNLTDSGHKHSDYITDKSDKADKVSGATSGNFAGLDANGNLTDSGHKHGDYLTEHRSIKIKTDDIGDNSLRLDRNNYIQLNSGIQTGLRYAYYSLNTNGLTGINPYSRSSAYNVGDKCTAAGIMYICTTPIPLPGEDWDESHWRQYYLDEVAQTVDGKLDKANVYEGVDKTVAGYALDARTGKSIYESVSNARKGMAYQAVLTGGNWQLHSGTDAAIGDYIWVNGQLGHATAAIIGGSTNIVENTNWIKETDGALNALNSKIPINGYHLVEYEKTVVAQTDLQFAVPSGSIPSPLSYITIDSDTVFNLNFHSSDNYYVRFYIDKSSNNVVVRSKWGASTSTLGTAHIFVYEPDT